MLAGGYYQPSSIDQAVRHWINQGATSVLFQLPNDFNNWDLLNPKFRNNLVTYLAKDNVDVTIVLPNVELDSETEIELIALQNLGVNFALCQSQTELNSNIAVQLKTRSNIVSLATDTSENLIPGVGWLNAGGLVVESVQLNLIDTELKLFEVSSAKQSVKNGEWEITTQLNGKLTDFGERFWMHLFKNDGDELLKLLSNDPVVEVAYSDRYQQSPASLLLITQVLGSLCNVLSAKPVLKVATLFNEKERSGQFLHQDWLYQDDHFAVFKTWIEHKAKVEPLLTVVDSRTDIAHRRLLTLTLASGQKINLKLDQGMGYWRLFEPQSHFQSIKFGFELDPAHQLAQLQKLEKEVTVRNSEDWSTDISYSIHG
ncbi:DEAD-box helicase-related protein [Vibrio sp. JCM 19052]|nr:DEAD-box helicase-related protein [Vibrio sp. JCM 19052]